MPLERALYLAGALACFAAAIVLTTGDVRSQPVRARPLAHAKARASAPALAAVEPARDAFEPRAALDDDAAVALRRIPVPAALLPHAPPSTARTTPAALVVTAIALGSLPAALVESAGNAQAVVAGDPLAGSRVTAITAAAIELADGRRLTLARDAGTP